jgi:predicted DNA-binding transcriptional regulator AlpA
MKGAEVIKFLGLGVTAGYRYLKHLEENSILMPVRLAGIKTPRWVRSEVKELAENREPIDCPKFVVNQ